MARKLFAERSPGIVLEHQVRSGGTREEPIRLFDTGGALSRPRSKFVWGKRRRDGPGGPTSGGDMGAASGVRGVRLPPLHEASEGRRSLGGGGQTDRSLRRDGTHPATDPAKKS